MGTTYGGYHQIYGDMLSGLTDQQERRLYEDLARKYRQQTLYMARRKNFELSAELNWNRNHAPTPVHLLRLKKPILPNRWISFREGWSKDNWGFTNADLTPYEVEEAVEKLMEEMRDPNFKKVLGALHLPEGVTIGEVVS